MAKASYKIPDTLDKSVLQARIPLTTKDGSFGKPITVASLLSYLGALLVWFLIISQTFVKASGIGGIIVFSIFYVLLAVMLLKKDDTDVPQMSLVITMLNYLPKSMRTIMTRKNSDYVDFLNFVGIKSVDEDGNIEFLDGDIGTMYRVSGSASVLLFEQDRDAIIDRCDTFYRKNKTDCEHIYITVKEPQKVYRQLSAMERRYHALDSDDPDLLAMADTSFRILRDDVGSRYKSIHQYLILKAKGDESLQVAKNVLQSEVEGSGMVFKRCARLNYDDIIGILKSIFKGKE